MTLGEFFLFMTFQQTSPTLCHMRWLKLVKTQSFAFPSSHSWQNKSQAQCFVKLVISNIVGFIQIHIHTDYKYCIQRILMFLWMFVSPFQMSFLNSGLCAHHVPDIVPDPSDPKLQKNLCCSAKRLNIHYSREWRAQWPIQAEEATEAQPEWKGQSGDAQGES